MSRGLAHPLKQELRTPEHLGTRRMVFRHLFYAFDATPPFAMRAAGAPFVLPQPPRGGPPTTVQFASGLLVDEAAGTLQISYSVLDCASHLLTLRLDAVLGELGLT